PIQARLRYPGEWHPIGNSTVLFHPDSQKVLAAYDMHRAGAGHVAIDHLYPLHIGSYGATVTRTVHFVVGLLPALFFATGLYLWWRRRRMRARRRRPGRRATERKGNARARLTRH
ncbi:MAG: PepSY domain-containing protein, partial [Thiohalorhabdaceae bacterium]